MKYGYPKRVWRTMVRRARRVARRDNGDFGVRGRGRKNKRYNYGS